MENNISQKTDTCKQLIENMGGTIAWVHIDIIVVDRGLWQVHIKEEFPNEIQLSVHVDICPVMAIKIYEKLSDSAHKMGMTVRIIDCYFIKFDENKKFIGLDFGKDAYKTVGREPLYGCCD